MGRAIVREPKLFLMDEPLSNLDAKLRVHTRGEISRLQRRLGITTMYVTHDQVEAMTMGDRVVVLRRGHLMQCASPQQLYQHPDNLFVAQFIGSPSMNVMHATVVEVGGQVALRIGTQTLPLNDAARSRLPGLEGMIGREVALGIRPETLGKEGTETLDVQVELVEMLGAELLVHATIDAPSVRQTDDGIETSDSTTSMIVASMDARDNIRVAERVSLKVDTTRIHVFDMATGDAIAVGA